MEKAIPPLNLMLNKGDKLEKIEIWRVKAVRQDFKKGINSRAFRNFLLSRKIGHSFYQSFLWLIPLGKQRLDEDKIREILSLQFKNFGEIRSLEIPNFNTEDIWLNVGVVLLRDALRFTLYEKFKNREDVVVRKLRVYNKREVVGSWTFTYAILGVSLSRIVPVDEDNVGILLFLVYELYDNFDQRVEDRYERQRYLTMASSCDYGEYIRRLNKMVNLIFPLTVHFSNKTLIFDKSFYQLASLKEEKKEMTRLDKWL